MSRTFKDRPVWVRRFEQRHGYDVLPDHRDGVCEPWTLSDASADSVPDRHRCQVESHAFHQRKRWIGSGPSRTVRQLTFTGPSRVRVEAVVARKTVNARGGKDIFDDIDIATFDHRHDATWQMW